MMSLSDSWSSPDDRLRDVVDHLDRNETNEALALLKPLLASEAPSLAARFVLAMTAWRLERADWSLSLLRECHEQAPGNGGIADVLASLLAQLGQLKESLFTSKLTTAFGPDPVFAALVPRGYPTFEHAFMSIVEYPLLGFARKAHAQGRLTKSIEFARQHVAIEPDHLPGREFYATCLMRAGEAAAVVETIGAVRGSVSANAILASLCARALTASGEAEAALSWHECALAAAPQDSAVAAARIANAPFLGDDEVTVAQRSRDWAERFSLSAKPARKHTSGDKLVIGYLASDFLDAEDAIAVAAVAQAHDRAQVTVLGYGCGAQTAEQNALLIGAFTKWRDIRDLDAATLARTWAGDGIDIVVDAGGFGSACQLQALSRCSTARRVSWLGNPAGIAAPLYDVCLTPADYPVLASRGERMIGAVRPLAFGGDIGLAQLDAPTVALWAAVLAGAPDAKLVLRARDMDHAANVARLIARFGETLAARIDLRKTSRTSEFYAAIDIALMPAHGLSPRAAAEALAHGVPPLALKSTVYGRFLKGIGLGETHVAKDAVGYHRLATQMVREAEARHLPAFDHGPDRLAQAIEALATSVHSQEHAA